MFLRKRYLHSRITVINQEIGEISREIRQLEQNLRRERKSAVSISPPGKAQEMETNSKNDSSRRLASYLSTGSFQTIAQHKFRSDLVRRRRLLIGGGILILIAATLIIWHFAA